MHPQAVEHARHTTNRLSRFLEKVRYKWRRRKTLVRFVVLTLDDIWSERAASPPKVADRSQPKRQGGTEGGKRKQRQAA